MPKLEAYHRKLNYSYALGLFPALNLMENRPEIARRLLINPEGEASEGLDKLRALCVRHGVREEEAARVLKRESKKDNCYAAIVFEKAQKPLAPDAPHVVLCQISDGGNLGTALRSLLGFGLTNVAIIRPCVDVFDPHVVRASMGAFFAMNVRVYDAFEDYRAEHAEHVLYPFMLDGAKPLHQVAKAHATKFALVFGNEQTGLPASFAELGQSVFIPQSDAIDSFNLAISVAIGAYAFTGEKEYQAKPPMPPL